MSNMTEFEWGDYKLFWNQREITRNLSHPQEAPQRLFQVGQELE